MIRVDTNDCFNWMDEALNNLTALFEVCRQSAAATLDHVKDTASQVDTLCVDMETCFIATNTNVMATIQMLQDDILSQQKIINILKQTISVGAPTKP